MNSDIKLLTALRDKLSITYELPDNNSKQIERIFKSIVGETEFNTVFNAPAEFSSFQFACYLDRFVNIGVIKANRLVCKEAPVLGLSVFATNRPNQYRLVGRVLKMPSDLVSIRRFIKALSDALSVLIETLDVPERANPEEALYAHVFCASGVRGSELSREEIQSLFHRLSTGATAHGSHVPHALFRLASWAGSDVGYKAEQTMDDFYKEILTKQQAAGLLLVKKHTASSATPFGTGKDPKRTTAEPRGR